MSEDLFLIVGLGNPGPRFARNRHNVGFQVVDLLAHQHHLVFQRAEFRAAVAAGALADRRVLLAKPQTFMNLAGQAVAPLARFYKIPLSQILVLYDELDLPLGRLRFRPEGGSGGHNGMKSLVDSLGTQAFARLRIGIDRPPGKMDPAAYVLQDFSSDQEIEMAFCRPRAAEGVVTWLREGIAAAMNKYNAV